MLVSSYEKKAMSKTFFSGNVGTRSLQKTIPSSILLQTFQTYSL